MVEGHNALSSTGAGESPPPPPVGRSPAPIGGEDAAAPAHSPAARRLEAWDMLLGLGQSFRRTPERVLPSARVPFTLLCGFLGSGKTTLVNHLLARPGGRRLAVLVNDFGALNIDAALIRGRGASAVELSNGCICCSLAGGLANALADLLARADKPDAIVVEASGVAEPAGIVHVALANGALSLAGIVAVADAESLPAQLADPALRTTVAAQLRDADLVLLNKTDLVDREELARARRAVGDTAPGARMLDTIRADVPLELVLGLPSRTAFASAEAPHQVPFSTWSFTSERPLDDRRLCAVAGDLPAAILRAKGVVHAASDTSRRFVLQVVGRRWTLDADEPWQGPPRSEIVLIGMSGAAGPAVLARLKECETRMP